MNTNWILIFLVPALMVLVKACEMPAYPSPQYPAFPSHGDLRLCPSGLVMIYMGPDGTNVEHMWGTFSGTLVGHQQYVENTLCQQLGYAEGKLTHGDSSYEVADYPVWISSVKCDFTYQHILRCDYTDAPNTTKHTYDWHLTCSMIVRSENAYLGQVALISPVGISTFSYSKSVGVVVFLEELRQWRFIVKDSSSFDFNIADTACRAMGFTHVVRNSVTTVKQYISSYGGNYSFNARMNGSSASSVDCSGSLQCLGCCTFNSPKVNFAKDYAMVVRCSFYEPTPHKALTSGGYKDICDTESHIGGQVCKSERFFSNKEFISAVAPLAAVLAGVLILICIIMGIIIVVKCKQCLPRYRYNLIPGVNDGNVNGGNEEGGDNGAGH